MEQLVFRLKTSLQASKVVLCSIMEGIGTGVGIRLGMGVGRGSGDGSIMGLYGGRHWPPEITCHWLRCWGQSGVIKVRSKSSLC